MAKIEPWHRRHALQLASQLPEGIEDALLVIEATRKLVEAFLKPEPADPLPDNVRSIRGGQGS
jgi:hypothetical protein